MTTSYNYGGYGATDDEENQDQLAPGEQVLDGSQMVSTPYLPPAVPLPAPYGQNMPGSAEALIRLLMQRRMGM